MVIVLPSSQSGFAASTAICAALLGACATGSVAVVDSDSDSIRIRYDVSQGIASTAAVADAHCAQEEGAVAQFEADEGDVVVWRCVPSRTRNAWADSAD